MNTLRKALGAILGLTLIFAAASLFTHNYSQAAKKTPSAAPARGYYLTLGVADGVHALGACTTGYHMASLWEIHEPSNLRYDQDPAGDGTNLGFTEPDSGQGPPDAVIGWIRTGAPSPYFNCAAWTTNDSGLMGSVVALSSLWNGAAIAVSPWDFSRMTCDRANSVWCVQD
jgi:hypothetical protein